MNASNIFAFVALGIIALPILASVAKRWMALKERQLEMTATLTAQQAASQASEIATLKERVAVLTRIVTDGEQRLASEIDALADQRDRRH